MARALEPQLVCVAALHSPSTGIVDSHGLMLSLLGDLENAGGLLAIGSGVSGIDCTGTGTGTGMGAGLVLTADDGTEIAARVVVNAAGLQAPALASRFKGLASSFIPKAFFAKGNYFTLSGRSPFSHLIYPVPEAAGLGVHLTLDLGGQAKFGPDVQWTDRADDLVVDPARGDAFYAEVAPSEVFRVLTGLISRQVARHLGDREGREEVLFAQALISTVAHERGCHRPMSSEAVRLIQDFVLEKPAAGGTRAY